MRWGDALRLFALFLVVGVLALMVGAPVMPACNLTTIEKTNKERAPYG